MRRVARLAAIWLASLVGSLVVGGVFAVLLTEPWDMAVFGGVVIFAMTWAASSAIERN